jgi:hypothetical protein
LNQQVHMSAQIVDINDLAARLITRQKESAHAA